VGPVPVCEYCFGFREEEKKEQGKGGRLDQRLRAVLGELSNMKNSPEFSKSETSRTILDQFVSSLSSLSSPINHPQSQLQTQNEEYQARIRKLEEQIRNLQTIKSSNNSDQKSEADSNSKPAQKPKGPSRIERDRKYWKVENFENRSDLEVSEATARQSVHIFGCSSCVITISSKVNQIFLDNCNGCTVIFDEIVSSVDMINCTKIHLHSKSKCPSFQIEKTTGVKIDIPSEELDTLHIVTFCAVDVIIFAIPKTKGEIVVEYTIPQQILSEISTEKQLISRTVSL